MPVEEQVVVLYAGTRGYLDKVKVTDIRSFEESYLKLIRENHSDLLTKIRQEKSLSSETDAKLAKIVGDFSANFVASKA